MQGIIAHTVEIQSNESVGASQIVSDLKKIGFRQSFKTLTSYCSPLRHMKDRRHNISIHYYQIHTILTLWKPVPNPLLTDKWAMIKGIQQVVKSNSIQCIHAIHKIKLWQNVPIQILSTYLCIGRLCTVAQDLAIYPSNCYRTSYVFTMLACLLISDVELCNLICVWCTP